MNYGDFVTVSCSISGGDIPIKIQWFFNSIPLALEGNSFGIVLEKRGQRLINLIIESASAKHIGNYTCKTSNIAGVIEYTTELKINGLFNNFIIRFSFYFIFQVPPKITPFTFGEQPMNFGEVVSISCIISGGDLPVNAEWYFNLKPLSQVSNLQDVIVEKRGQRIYNLMIESVSAKHIGNYTCRTSNQAGVVDMSSELNVNGSFK